MRRVLVAAAGAVLAALLAAGAGSAASRETTTVGCSNGETVTVVAPSPPNEHAQSWGVGQIVGGSGHLIPTSFSGVATDVTTSTEVFSFSDHKGNGNANGKQAKVTCSFGDSASAADFFGSDPLPPGVEPDDVIAFTFTVTAVWKA